MRMLEKLLAFIKKLTYVWFAAYTTCQALTSEK